VAKKKTKKKPRTKKAASTYKPPRAKCSYCKKKKVITDGECDDGWGEPDVSFSREICADCAPGVNARYQCAAAIFEAMEKKLKKKKGFDHREIDSVIKQAWYAFHVELDTKSMVALGRKLKVKHPWLKGKRSK
jgi:hypothetical protein